MMLMLLGAVTYDLKIMVTLCVQLIIIQYFSSRPCNLAQSTIQKIHNTLNVQKKAILLDILKCKYFQFHEDSLDLVAFHTANQYNLWHGGDILPFRNADGTPYSIQNLLLFFCAINKSATGLVLSFLPLSCQFSLPYFPFSRMLFLLLSTIPLTNIFTMSS